MERLSLLSDLFHAHPPRPYLFLTQSLPIYPPLLFLPMNHLECQPPSAIHVSFDVVPCCAAAPGPGQAESVHRRRCSENAVLSDRAEDAKGSCGHLL